MDRTLAHRIKKDFKHNKSFKNDLISQLIKNEWLFVSVEEIFFAFIPTILSVHSVSVQLTSETRIEVWVHIANPVSLKTWWAGAGERKFASLRRGGLFITNIWVYMKIAADVEVDFDSAVTIIKRSNAPSSKCAVGTDSSWCELGFTQSQLWIDISSLTEDQRSSEGRTKLIWNIFCYRCGRFVSHR